MSRVLPHTNPNIVSASRRVIGIGAPNLERAPFLETLKTRLAKGSQVIGQLRERYTFWVDPAQERSFLHESTFSRYAGTRLNAIQKKIHTALISTWPRTNNYKSYQYGRAMGKDRISAATRICMNPETNFALRDGDTLENALRTGIIRCASQSQGPDAQDSYFTVEMHALRCSCRDSQRRKSLCKHIISAIFTFLQNIKTTPLYLSFSYVNAKLSTLLGFHVTSSGWPLNRVVKRRKKADTLLAKIFNNDSTLYSSALIDTILFPTLSVQSTVELLAKAFGIGFNEQAFMIAVILSIYILKEGSITYMDVHPQTLEGIYGMWIVPNLESKTPIWTATDRVLDVHAIISVPVYYNTVKVTSGMFTCDCRGYEECQEVCIHIRALFYYLYVILGGHQKQYGSVLVEMAQETLRACMQMKVIPRKRKYDALLEQKSHLVPIHGKYSFGYYVQTFDGLRHIEHKNDVYR